MHDMKIETIYGEKLFLCQKCGAHHDRKKKIWFSVGAKSKQEPPCDLESQEWKEWRKNAEKCNDFD